MSSDGTFRPVSPAAMQKMVADPRLADIVMSFHPVYDQASQAFHWPERVRELWDALLASGGSDAAAATGVQEEMQRLTRFRFFLEPQRLQALAAAGIGLDEIGGSEDFCGAKWPQMHFLLTGTLPGAPGQPWRPQVPLTPLLGPRVVGTDEWEGGRGLTADETAAAANALASVSDDEMRARYDDFVRGPKGVLPDGWEEQRDEMLEVFARVRACYAAARDRGDAMLVYLD
jgi:hypothetical protein